ncbi:MAG TPA: AraC family transcriptional regulator [Candidatus Angelobacter sp.]|nr:AraC family transcriptional regulator [Candidatus Angelobacter sp.]
MSAPRANWLIRAPGEIERIEAQFWGSAFAPHRHDTYVIGITIEGAQSFNYRGCTRQSRPGQVVVLHPDELHDGRAGDGAWFRYKAAYIAPAVLQNIIAGRPLPFVSGGISDSTRLKRAVIALLNDYDRPLNETELQDALFDLAMALEAVGGVGRTIRAVNRSAVMQARAYIDAHIEQGFSLADLESETRQQRWQLSRDFRKLLGTSPYRYLIARRLDNARALIAKGQSSAAVAHTCGFADQSHFGRSFRKAFGLTPLAWARANAHNRSIPDGVARPY